MWLISDTNNYMFQSIHSVALYGMDGIPIRVEADVRDGFPSFEMLGYLSGQVKEAGGRVRSALHNSGYSLAPKRICINLSPANVKKEGNAFDLPIAVAILTSMISVDQEKLIETMFVGELGLDGSVRRISGVLPIVLAAKEAGMKYCVIPQANINEVALIQGLFVIGVNTLQEVLELLCSNEKMESCYHHYREYNQLKTFSEGYRNTNSEMEELDFSDVAGQKSVRRAIEIAASGGDRWIRKIHAC